MRKIGRAILDAGGWLRLRKGEAVLRLWASPKGNDPYRARPIGIATLPILLSGTLAFVALLLAFLNGTGTTAQDGKEGDENLSDRPVLDLGYDDSWVANVPDFIGGYRVIHIGTPRSVACSRSPLITLLAPQKSMDEYLGSAPDVRSLLQTIPGLPSDVQLSFAGSAFDEEEATVHQQRWNERNLKDGCIRLGGIQLELPNGNK